MLDVTIKMAITACVAKIHIPKYQIGGVKEELKFVRLINALTYIAHLV